MTTRSVARRAAHLCYQLRGQQACTHEALQTAPYSSWALEQSSGAEQQGVSTSWPDARHSHTPTSDTSCTIGSCPAVSGLAASEAFSAARPLATQPELICPSGHHHSAARAPLPPSARHNGPSSSAQQLWPRIGRSHGIHGQRCYSSDVIDTRELQAQLATVVSAEQLNDLLDTYMHIFDRQCLKSTADLLVRSIAAMRTSPAYPSVTIKLASLYRQHLPSLPVEDAVSLLHSCAMLKINPGGDEEGLQAVCDHLKAHVVPELVQRQQYAPLGELAWALYTISHHGELEIDPEIYQQCEPVIRMYLSTMPLSLMSKVATAFAGTGEAQFGFLEHLPLVLSQRLQPDMYANLTSTRPGGTRMRREFDPGAVTNIMKALSQVKAAVSSTLLHQVAAHVVNHSRGLKLHHLVSLAKSLAQLSYGADEEPSVTEPFWRTVSGVVTRERHNLTPQMVQDVAYAWALRKVGDEGLFKVLSGVARTHMDRFKPVNLSILLWAMARQGYVKETDLFKLASLHIQNHIQQYSIQNIANSIWALACVDFKDEELMKFVADHLKLLLQDPEGRSQLMVEETEDGGTVERFVVPGKCSLVERYKDSETDQVLQRIEYKSGNTVVRRLGQGIPTLQYNTQNLTDLMWAYGRLDHRDADLFSLLCARSIQSIDTFTLTSVVDCCWALTQVEFAHPEMLQSLESHMTKTCMVPQMGLGYLSDVLFAMAIMHHQPTTEFLQECMDACLGKWGRSGRDEATTVRLVYSLEQLGVLDKLPAHPFVHNIQDYVELALQAEAQEAQQQQPGAEQPQAPQQQPAYPPTAPRQPAELDNSQQQAPTFT